MTCVSNLMTEDGFKMMTKLRHLTVTTTFNAMSCGITLFCDYENFDLYSNLKSLRLSKMKVSSKSLNQYRFTKMKKLVLHKVKITGSDPVDNLKTIDTVCLIKCEFDNSHLDQYRVDK